MDKSRKLGNRLSRKPSNNLKHKLSSFAFANKAYCKPEMHFLF